MTEGILAVARKERLRWKPKKVKDGGLKIDATYSNGMNRMIQSAMSSIFGQLCSGDVLSPMQEPHSLPSAGSLPARSGNSGGCIKAESRISFARNTSHCGDEGIRTCDLESSNKSSCLLSLPWLSKFQQVPLTENVAHNDEDGVERGQRVVSACDLGTWLCCVVRL